MMKVFGFLNKVINVNVKKNSFDTICHEHLEYYSLKQIIWILDRANMKVLDVEFNNINGGSFSITAAKRLIIQNQFDHHKQNYKR